MSDVVRIERSAQHATLVIDHPKANAINAAVIAGLSSALDACEGDDSVRVVVIRGAGERFFAAGADITEFPAAAAEGRAGGGGQELTLRIEALPKPVVAALNGMALGGGCELAMACDIRVAVRSARLGQPEINLGIIPGWGGTQRLPRLVGRSAAMPLLLTGEPIDAEAALGLGLVHEVVGDADLDEAVQRWVDRLATRAPLALAATKRAVVQGLDRPLADGLRVEAEEFARIFTTEDAREGVGAYLEKRAPVWRGR